MATNAELGKLVVAYISEIAFAPCGSGSGNYHFDSIEIVLAQTNATSLSTTFSTNLATNPQTVLKATNYDWNVTAGAWNRIGFDQPYLYISGRGTNLVIQLTLMGNHKTGSVGTGFHRDATHQRVYRTGWTGSPPATGSSGSAALKFEVAVNMADLHTFDQHPMKRTVVGDQAQRHQPEHFAQRLLPRRGRISGLSRSVAARSRPTSSTSS